MRNMVVRNRVGTFLNSQGTERTSPEVPRFVDKDDPLNGVRKVAFKFLQDHIEFVGRSAGLPPSGDKPGVREETTPLLGQNTAPSSNIPVRINKSIALTYLDELKELISIVQTKMNGGGGNIENNKIPVLSSDSASTRGGATIVNSTSSAKQQLLDDVEKICAHRNAPLKTQKITLSSCFGPNYTDMAKEMLKKIDATKKGLQKLPPAADIAPPPAVSITLGDEGVVEGAKTSTSRGTSSDVVAASLPPAADIAPPPAVSITPGDEGVVEGAKTSTSRGTSSDVVAASPERKGSVSLRAGQGSPAPFATKLLTGAEQAVTFPGSPLGTASEGGSVGSPGVIITDEM